MAHHAGGGVVGEHAFQLAPRLVRPVGDGHHARVDGSPDANTAAVEKLLSDALGLSVDIDHQGSGGGTLRIRYRTLEQLDDIIRRLEKPRQL